MVIRRECEFANELENEGYAPPFYNLGQAISGVCLLG